MSTKKNKFDKFLEELPVQFDIVKQLNDNFNEIVEKLHDEEKFPLSNYCDAELIYDGRQYGASDENYSKIWYLKDYKIHVMLEYNYTSYNGSSYELCNFVKVKPVTHQVTVYEEIKNEKTSFLD